MVVGKGQASQLMHWSLVGYSALGVLVLASRQGHEGLRIWVPGKLISTFKWHDNRNTQVEFVVFIVIGSLIGIVVGGPDTPRQAVAAGLGWTGLLTVPNSPASKRRGKNESGKDKAD